jgi:hypothetical protein
MNIFTVDNFFSDTVSHGFFGRQGGVSTGLYESLNCHLQAGDSPDAVAENRTRALNKLGGKTLSTLKQIHSARCLTVGNEATQGNEEGDALVTKTAGQAIGVLTADCAPVLFAGNDKSGAPIIGVAHAGWGGALKGVLENTITAMINLGAELSSIKAAIGPCIAQESYEVDKDFLKSFVDEDAQTSRFFKNKNSEKSLFDLQGYVQYRLVRAGILQISLANTDTYAREAEYFSYRRATHREESGYGRQISGIMINF